MTTISLNFQSFPVYFIVLRIVFLVSMQITNRSIDANYRYNQIIHTIGKVYECVSTHYKCFANIAGKIQNNIERVGKSKGRSC